MKTLFLALALATIALAVPTTRGEAAQNQNSCQKGYIPCDAWCRRHPLRTTCLTGHPNSCDKKANGLATCVSL
jgi:hypothetical protein